MGIENDNNTQPLQINFLSELKSKLKNSKSVDEGSRIISEDQEEQTPYSSKVFLKPKKSLKKLTKLATNLSRSMSKESPTTENTEREDNLEVEVDHEPEAEKTTEVKMNANPHHMNLMAELNLRLKKSGSCDPEMFKPEPPLKSQPRFHSVPPHMENVTSSSSTVEIEAGPDSRPETSQPSPGASNFLLRPNSKKRTATSIRLDDAFSILEGELCKTDQLSNIQEDEEIIIKKTAEEESELTANE